MRHSFVADEIWGFMLEPAGSRLLVAVGGSLRFGCQHSVPRRIRSSGGHPFGIIAVVNKKILVRFIRAKMTIILVVFGR